jgi:hypothetical protein
MRESVIFQSGNVGVGDARALLRCDAFMERDRIYIVLPLVVQLL